jgi:hypothetical protein
VSSLNVAWWGVTERSHVLVSSVHVIDRRGVVTGSDNSCVSTSIGSSDVNMSGFCTRGSSGTLVCQCHWAPGVACRSAADGRMWLRTGSDWRNSTNGSQNISGWDLHGSRDISMCKRGVRGFVDRSPHMLESQPLCGF